MIAGIFLVVHILTALLVEQRRQLLARMEDIRASLERLDRKIEGYEKGLACKERELRGHRG